MGGGLDKSNKKVVKRTFKAIINCCRFFLVLAGSFCAQKNHKKRKKYLNDWYIQNEDLILKQLHKNLTREELYKVSEETPETYKGGIGSKFWEVMKLFGIVYVNDVAEDTRSSIYAKWALDNWTEDGDYGSIEQPIKAPLKWYEIDRAETGSQIEYKDGTAEVLGFDGDEIYMASWPEVTGKQFQDLPSTVNIIPNVHLYGRGMLYGRGS